MIVFYNYFNKYCQETKNQFYFFCKLTTEYFELKKLKDR
jgi:hypothetical protein